MEDKIQVSAKSSSISICSVSSKTNPQVFQFVPHYNLCDSFWDLFVCQSKHSSSPLLNI